MVIVLLGVSGAGKTTIGQLLAAELGWTFFEGDDFHSNASKDKMRAGIPLTDADRQPWLEAIRSQIDDVLARGENAVVACSALKRSYRDRLRREGVTMVYLKSDSGLVQRRLEERQGHFFDRTLLASQFAALEEPACSVVVDVANPPDSVVRQIVRRLGVEAHQRDAGS